MHTHKSAMAIAALCALAACGGGGGDSAPPAIVDPAPPGVTQPPVVPGSGKFTGTLTTSQASQGSVELLSADGTLRTSAANAQGQFEFSTDGLQAPLLLRGRTPSGEVVYAASARLPGNGDTVNINPLTQLVSATIAPQGDPAKLWDLPVAQRTERIRDNRDAVTGQITSAVAPVAAALNLPATTDFSQQPLTGNTGPVATLLDSLQIQTYALGNSTAFSLAAARTPALRSVWQANAQSVPVVQLSPQYPPTLTAAGLAAVEASYAATRQGASQFDPAKMNQAELTRILQEMQKAIANPNITVAQMLGLYRSFLLAMGFPSAFADEVVQQMGGANPMEGLELMASFFGPEGQRSLQAMANMQVTLVSTDPSSQLAIYKIVLDGKTYYQSWSLATGKGVTGRTTQRDFARQCIKERYVGPTGPSERISPEQLIDNLEAFNTCDFTIQYASCIWSAGTTGPQNSGCSSGVSTGTVRPQESTNLRAVRSGPLYEQRVFVACQSPAKPVSQGTPLLGAQPAFALQWQCVG